MDKTYSVTRLTREEVAILIGSVAYCDAVHKAEFVRASEAAKEFVHLIKNPVICLNLKKKLCDLASRVIVAEEKAEV